MKENEWIVDLARSIAFLSRLPVSSRFFRGHDGSMDRTVRAFPLAGAVLLAPVGLLLALVSATHAGALFSAIAALTLQIMLTGALHEDGLADSADGLGGNHQRERALQIMKDSRNGTYGVVALILSLGLRATAIAALVNHLSPMDAALCLIGVGAASRALMVWHWQALPSARPEGLAASLGKPTEKSLHAALFLGVALAVITIGPATSLSPLAIALVTTALSAYAVNAFVERRLGGRTGDTIGAMQQIAEIVALGTLAATV
ncbi:adenosylcobinamide-GDP ribazoletransferase [Rhizobium paknamense]|uniref:Adenosylcobinamide-GDP ribazoletransferase n=1 Tax=Rhizobium paknamense TaxID=1206817 RepID=A0ABU0IGA1_9HYPH|nr:adenosylcobinamide-GDP ribazoletransferase [Rhizobium paknamense]MDQ0457181.1 adenosylcobinamide-GDP ribazoletransferase [Rhizobium paknamense]